MDDTTRRKLQGLHQLVVDSVHATVDQTEGVHNEFARYPYALLKRITPIAAPVRVVEYAQMTVTGWVYRSIRAVTVVAGTAAAVTLAAIPRDKQP